MRTEFSGIMLISKRVSDMFNDFSFTVHPSSCFPSLHSQGAAGLKGVVSNCVFFRREVTLIDSPGVVFEGNSNDPSVAGPEIDATST